MAAMKQKYPTVRVSAETHSKIKQMAEDDCVSMSDLVEQAVESYRRQRVWAHANNVWNEMMKDPDERAYWAREDAELEGTLMDGLEDDEQWNLPSE